MPMLSSLIPESTTHIVEPVVEQAIKRVLLSIGCLHLFENNFIVKTGYTGISDTTDNENNANINANMCICEVTPQSLTGAKWDVLTFSHLTSLGISKQQQFSTFPILKEKENDVYFYEHHVPFSFSINCTLTFTTRENAYDAHNALFSLYGGMDSDGAYLLDDTMFDYAVPNDALSVIYSIYKLKDFETPTTFASWLRKCSNKVVSISIGRRLNSQFELVIKRTLKNILGKVSYSADKPEEVQDNDSVNAFNVTFTYDVQFAKPHSVHLSYPIIIENKLLPIEMIPLNKSDRLKFNSPYSNMAFAKFAKNYVFGKKINPFKSPWYDDWMLPSHAACRKFKFVPFLIMALTLDTDLPDTRIKLDADFGEGVKLADDVLEEIRKYKSKVLMHNCKYNISLFANSNEVEPALLTIDDDLNLIIPHRDHKRVYHLVFSQQTDISMIHRDNHERAPDGELEVDDKGNVIYKGYRYGYNIPLRIINTDIVSKRRDYPGPK